MTAAAPPSAETVWLRIGYTFETRATRSAGSVSATAMAARRPAPPPPITRTSWTCVSMRLSQAVRARGERGRTTGRFVVKEQNEMLLVLRAPLEPEALIEEVAVGSATWGPTRRTSTSAAAG